MVHQINIVSVLILTRHFPSRFVSTVCVESVSHLSRRSRESLRMHFFSSGTTKDQTMEAHAVIHGLYREAQQHLTQKRALCRQSQREKHVFESEKHWHKCDVEPR